MLKKLILFELNYYRKQLVFWLALAYSLLAGTLMVTNTFETLYFANSSYSTLFAVSIFTSLSTIFIVGFMAATSLLKDSENDFESIIFATPIDKYQYLFAKFTGLFGVSFIIHFVAVCAMMAAPVLLEAERVGPFNPVNYIYGLLVVMLPNVLFCSSVIFATAMFSKKMMPIYIVTILVYIIYIAASMLGNSPIMAMSTSFTQEGAGISTLLDPYGIIAFFEQSSFWSVEEKNVLLPEIKGNLLYNRLIWLTISISLFALTYKYFSFKIKNQRPKEEAGAVDISTPKYSYKDVDSITVNGDFNFKTFFSKLKIEYHTVVKGLPFIIIVCLLAMVNLITIAEQIARGPLDQTSYYPLTELILELLQDPLSKIGLLISIFYSVELYWKERSHKVDAIVDSTPAKNSMFFLSKLSTLSAISFTLILVSVVTAILYQFSVGFFDVKPLLYLRLFYYSGATLILVGGFTLFMQNFAPNKATGLALGSLVFIYPYVLKLLDLYHPLAVFAYTPTFIFSDMTNSIYHEEAYAWSNLYWLAFVGLISLFTIKLWKRGASNHSEKLSKPLKLTGIIFLLIFIGSVAYKFYQYNIKNSYTTKDERNAYKAYYEKTYSVYEDLVQPTITHINVNVDVYPDQRRYVAQGQFVFQNKTSDPIDKLMISVQQVDYLEYDINVKDAPLESENKADQVMWYRLNNPLLAGESSTLDFSIDITRTAFSRLDGENYVTSGGSYFELEDYLPFFGYLDTYELQNNKTRLEYGLEETNFIDPKYAEPLYTDNWIYFSSRISTSEDQVAVTVGNLVKEDLKNGRRYFHYETDQKIKRVFPITSANFNVATYKHNNVEIQIFHDPEHDKDNPHIVEALKAGLDYFQQNFAPYTFKNFKVVELPYFSSEQSFGAAFPGMYGGVENRFFNLDVEGAKRNPSLRGVVHEFSHQYWGGYISPNGIGGYSMLTEVLSKYSELVLQEKVYGKYSNNNELRQALGIYLRNRSRVVNVERPLSTLDFNPMVFYAKGLHSMTALKDLIGEEKINHALRNLLEKHRHPNRPTSLDLLKEYYSVADSSQHHIIKDLFERVVFHDFKIDSVHVTDPDNSYKTELHLTSLKYVLNEETNTEFAEIINDSIEVAFYDGFPDAENKNMTFLQKVEITQEKTVLSFKSEKKPKFIKVDPNNYRIDRSLEDNIIEVK